MSNNAMAAFREKAKASDGLFLKPKDIEDTQRFKIIPWILKDKVHPVIFFYEGWVNSGKKDEVSSPVRFYMDDEGNPSLDPDESYAWAKGEYGLQTPVQCFACVVADLKHAKLKLLSGTQKTLLAPFADFAFEESEKYIKNWKAYDILITRNAKDKKFTVEREKLDEDERKYPDWLEQELNHFTFSFDSFMRGDKQEEGEGNTYTEVLALSRGGSVEEKSAKKENKKNKESENAEFKQDPNWASVVTPKGKVLGQCELEELEKMVEVLSKKGTPDSNPLMRAIKSGVLANQPIESEETEEKNFFDDDADV